TSGRRVGARGSCSCAGKSWTTGVRNRGGEGQERRAVPIGRRGNHVEKGDGGRADRRLLVHERDLRRPQERRHCLCAVAKPVPFERRRAYVYDDQGRAGG